MTLDPDDLVARIRLRRHRLAEEILNALRTTRTDPRWPSHARLFLFGSRARHEATAGSDIDVIVAGALTPTEREDVDRLLRERLHRWPLDVVFVGEANDLSTKLAWGPSSLLEIEPNRERRGADGSPRSS